MTAQQEAEVLERYFEWRQERIVEGVDITTAAYREHLYNQEVRETLAEIGRMARDLGIQIDKGDADDRDLDAFRRSILALIPEPKEVAA